MLELQLITVTVYLSLIFNPFFLAIYWQTEHGLDPNCSPARLIKTNCATFIVFYNCNLID